MEITNKVCYGYGSVASDSEGVTGDSQNLNHPQLY